MAAENTEAVAVLDIMEQHRQSGDIEGFKLELGRLNSPMTADQREKARTLGRDPGIWKSIFLDAANADQIRDTDPEGSKRELLQSLSIAKILGMLDRHQAPALYRHFESYAQRAGISLTGEPAPEPVAATATKEIDPLEERAERLVRSISYAEFGSFQEYLFAAERSGNQFDLNSGQKSSKSFPATQEATDIIPMYKGTEIVDDRTIAVVYGFMQYFHMPIGDSLSSRIPFGSLFCTVGKKDGQFIVQGAGTIHRDSVRRQNDSMFKIVFSSDTEFNDFINWLKDSPSEALSLTVENLVQKSRQKPGRPESGGGLQNVYSRQRWIGKLTVENVDTQEIVVKDFEEPLLHQERINSVEREIRQHGSIQQARDVYQKRAEDSTDRQAQESAKWMLSIMNAYEAEYGQPASRMESGNVDTTTPPTPAADRAIIEPPADKNLQPETADADKPNLPDPHAILAAPPTNPPRTSTSGLITLDQMTPEERAQVDAIIGGRLPQARVAPKPAVADATQAEYTRAARPEGTSLEEPPPEPIVTPQPAVAPASAEPASDEPTSSRGNFLHPRKPGSVRRIINAIPGPWRQPPPKIPPREFYDQMHANIGAIPLEDLPPEARAQITNLSPEQPQLASHPRAEEDYLLERAIALKKEGGGNVPISVLQKKLGIGFPRAARLLDQLEALEPASHLESGNVVSEPETTGQKPDTSPQKLTPQQEEIIQRLEARVAELMQDGLSIIEATEQAAQEFKSKYGRRT